MRKVLLILFILSPLLVAADNGDITRGIIYGLFTHKIFSDYNQRNNSVHKHAYVQPQQQLKYVRPRPNMHNLYGHRDMRQNAYANNDCGIEKKSFVLTNRTIIQWVDECTDEVIREKMLHH